MKIFAARIVVAVLMALALLFGAGTAATRKHKSGRPVPQLSASYYKHLAGPPSEFPLHVLPKPSDGAIESRSALLSVIMHENAVDSSSVGYETKFPVDSESDFKLTVLSPIANDLVIEISPPSSQGSYKLVNAADLADDYCQAAGLGKGVEKGIFGQGSTSVPSITFSFPKPKTGLWMLRITSKASALEALAHPEEPHVLVLFDMDSELMTWSHTVNFDLETGKQIGLVTRLIDASQRQKTLADGTPSPIRFAPDTVVLEVRLPGGQTEEVPMKDDGMHSDGVANDGIYGATILATEEGVYTFQVVMHGKTNDGRDFLRTTQHLIETVDDDYTLTGEVLGEMSTDDKALMLSLLGTWTPNQEEFTFKGYMEVWGVDAETGTKEVPIAWVGGLADAQPAPPSAATIGTHALTFRLDTNWIAMAKAKAPFSVRNVFVQDRLNSIPLTTLDEAPVTLRRFASSRRFEDLRFDGVITEEMLKGPRPQFLANPSNATTAEGHKLILVHGYCAPTVSWKLSDFTDYAVFEDFDQNRSNDEFARLIVQFASQFPSFSLVSHSQGGLAALHLYTFYWSGADNANGKRFLQSVGSPYQGSGLAGILAKIGKIFGIGCDTNFDLTHDGARLWLASISAEARSQVDYYTTQYKKLSFCNLAAQAVLRWPNDGVVEKDYCELPGGNYKSHVTGWCHSVNFKYPPQTTDSSRNHVLDKNAYRG